MKYILKLMCKLFGCLDTNYDSHLDACDYHPSKDDVCEDCGRERKE